MVSFIILSYNTRELLVSCIQSVIDHGVQDFEVIVVDNASHDGSADQIKKQFPQVRVIENSENAGFAKGVNIGAEHAKGDYLLFLNSDAEITEDTVSQLIQPFEMHEKAGVVGGLLKNTDGSMQRSFSRFYDLVPVFLLLFGGDRVELVGHSVSNIQAVDWVSGGCMMIRKDVFDKVGRFDENFFMYLEDMELCKRVKQQGYEIYFNPHAEVTHIGQGSSNRQFAITHIYKGLLYYYRKHKNIVSVYVLQGMLTIKAVLAIGIGTAIGKKELVRTYRKALQMI